MGGYETNFWYRHIEMTFNASYLNHLYDGALMAVVFGYRKELFDRVRYLSMPCEFYDIAVLEHSYPLNIYVKNGNLTIEN